MSVFHEKTFEAEIVAGLMARGWLEGDPKGYDRKLALYPEDVIDWIRDTQPNEYAKVVAAQNGGSDGAILDRLMKSREEQGTLHVLRHGFKRVNARFEMCAFKPGSELNPDALVKYEAVRCRVVRQIHYSLHNERSIDLVLFVNGLPVATLELKTDFTQSVGDATAQYRFERNPVDQKSGKPEPLLTFKRGALVHFAASTDEVRMTTLLAGAKTAYLPFNLGNYGAAGNPPSPTGHRTAYLWEYVLQRDACLELIEKFIHLEVTKKKIDGKLVTREAIIFPRYHQWDAVRRLVDAAKTEGAGQKYLIQHSAGSGKSNTIMWLAHQLTSAHDAADKKIFNSIIIVTDRQVLDEQLQETVGQFEHEAGLVVNITRKEAKSAQLGEALRTKSGIILVTIQTFPYALDAIAALPDVAQRTFAVIADEAHSSQTGEAAKHLRESLGIIDAEPGEDEEPVSAEDALRAQMAKRAGAKNISYFAFTATPKAKTIELFGRNGPSGNPEPFHVYSMQQAIDEGFILDVLLNYTTYKIAYKLAASDKGGAAIVPKSETAKLIKRFATLHPYDVGQKAEVIVEHFRETVWPLLDGRAKAMVVCDSRKQAVRFKLAIDRYVSNQKYDLGTLVAFSGEVTDDSGGVSSTFTESSMNALHGESIPEAFGGPHYHVLIVAEKYQTGFDQPLLVAMYVNKKLANIAAVQTLSRLNRTYERDGIKKEKTFVLDFVNDGADIVDAFRPYYKVAALSDVTDPDIIHDLQAKLDAAGVYTSADVERFFEARATALDAKVGEKTQGLLKAALDPVVDHYRAQVSGAKQSGHSEEPSRLENFRKHASEFVRAYAFLSQIYNYGDTDLEKRALFLTALGRLLKDDRDAINIDVSDVRMTHYHKKVSFDGSLGLSNGKPGELHPPAGIGTARAREKQYGALAEIISAMNEVLGLDVAEEHRILLASVVDRAVIEDPTLAAQSRNNSREQFKNAGDVERIVQERLVDAQAEIATKNDAQNVAIADVLVRLFNDKAGLRRVVDAYGDRVYDFHNQSGI